MSADTRIPPRFVIEFDYDAPLARIAEVLRPASYHNVTVTHDTGGMGKAHLRELNEKYGLNIEPAKPTIEEVQDAYARVAGTPAPALPTVEERLTAIVRSCLERAEASVFVGEPGRATEHLRVAETAASLMNCLA